MFFSWCLTSTVWGNAGTQTVRVQKLKLSHRLVNTDCQLKYEIAFIIAVLFHQCFILFLMLAVCKTSLVSVMLGLTAVYFSSLYAHVALPILSVAGSVMFNLAGNSEMIKH